MTNIYRLKNILNKLQLLKKHEDVWVEVLKLKPTFEQNIKKRDVRILNKVFDFSANERQKSSLFNRLEGYLFNNNQLEKEVEVIVKNIYKLAIDHDIPLENEVVANSDIKINGNNNVVILGESQDINLTIK